MNDRFSLVVLTPEKKLLDVEAKSVRVILADGGSMGILPGHAKLIAATVAGDLDYLDMQGNKQHIKLGGGILLIDGDLVQVLTNTLYAEELEDSEDDVLFDRMTSEIISRLKIKSSGTPVSFDE